MAATKELTYEELMRPPTDEIKAKAKTMITRQRIQLLCSTTQSPFFAHLAMNLILKEASSEISTMGTDGAYLYYNANWTTSLTEDQCRAAICHEAMHPALGHLWRRGTREHERCNIACDYVINRILEKNGFTLWERPAPLLDEQYDNMAFEEVYALLPPSPPPIEITISIGMGKGQSLGEGGTMDNHDFWDKAGSQQKDGGTGKDADGEIIENNEQVWKERLARAAIAAKMQGKLPSDIAGLVEATIEPKLPWRELLRNYVQDTTKTDYRMMPPSKRYLHIPLYMPSLKGEFLEIAVAVDTSGSISQPELETFVSEMQGIADSFENYRIHVYACDAAVHNYTVVESYDEWPKEYGGRGGTDFTPVFEDIEKQGLEISVLIYLTDSYGTFPKEAPSYPVLWVINAPNREVPFGDQIFLDMNEKGS
jgi:predicted metal-dependent peptidase